MHELVLHSYRRCPFAIRVRMTLEEKQIPYTVIEENLSDFSEQLLRLHPEGKVPLLIHQGKAIHESSVITEYLDEAFAAHPLRPEGALAKAEMRLWTYWCNEMFKPDLDLYKYEFKDLGEQERSDLMERMGRHLAKLSAALEHQLFLMGQELTLTDIHVFPFYRQLQKAHPDFATHFQAPRVDAWLERIVTRPSFTRVMAMQKSVRN